MALAGCVWWRSDAASTAYLTLLSCSDAFLLLAQCALMTPHVIYPSSGYDPSFTCYDIWKHAAGLMAQPFNRMEVTYLPVYVPTAAEKKDPHLFANNVRALIARTLDVPTLELEWMHKLPYELSPKKRAQGLEMLQAANGGKPFTLPTFTEDRNGKPVAATGGGGASSGGGGAAGGGGGGGGKGTGKDKGREAKKDK